MRFSNDEIAQIHEASMAEHVAAVRSVVEARERGGLHTPEARAAQTRLEEIRDRRLAEPRIVYVPAADSRYAVTIHAKSGIVGAPVEGERILIFYEGNRLGSEDMKTFADRCFYAAGRFAARAATIAFALVPSTEMVRVGLWLGEQGQVEVEDAETLARWLEVELSALDPSDFMTTSGRAARRRELETALARSNYPPELQRQILANPKRYGLPS